MGYIYLMPPKCIYSNDNNHLGKYIEQENIEIPLIRNNEISYSIDSLKLMSRTYKDAVYKYFDINMDYCNDLDNEGYIVGVELDLGKEKFIDLITNKAFKIIQGNWKNKDVCVLTLDLIDKVFSSYNIIYPLNKKRDSFVIVYIEPKYKIGLVKALITCRNDIYPIDYLKAPEFILSE
jgi:hypothetical protein